MPFWHLMALQDEAKDMASLLVGGDWNHGIFLVNLWLIIGKTIYLVGGDWNMNGL